MVNIILIKNDSTDNSFSANLQHTFLKRSPVLPNFSHFNAGIHEFQKLTSRRLGVRVQQDFSNGC